MEYRAPEPCPTEAEFLQSVAERTETSRPAELGEEDRAFGVEIVEAQGMWRGTLRFTNAIGTPMIRGVEATACPEVADALAIMAALALDSQHLEGGPQSSAESTATPTEPGASSAADPTAVAPSEPTLAFTASPMDLATRRRAKQEQEDDARRERAARQNPGMRRSALRSHSARAPLIGPEALGWALGAAFSVRSEISPALLSPGGELVLWRIIPERWRFRVALGAASSGEAVVDGHRASFAWTGGTLDGCRELPLTGVSGCLSVDVGAIAATGEEDATITSADTEWRSWVASGPAVRLRVPVSESWSVHLGLAGRFAAVRPKFHYAAEPDVIMHRPEPWAFAMTLDVAYSFRERAVPQSRGSQRPHRDMRLHDGITRASHAAGGR